MRYVRFGVTGETFWGRLSGDGVEVLSSAPWDPAATLAGQTYDLASIRFRPPVLPSKILAIGRNYRAHAEELGNEVPKEPLVFMKPPSSLLAHGGQIVLPPESNRVDFEGELALVIGKRGRRIPEEEAMTHVFGFSPSLDITARDLQKVDGQWWRAKGFDTFCPIGPAIETDVDASDLAIETRIDGAKRQSSRTSMMIFSLPRLVSWISQAMTLEPGDVILTGTPEGVGPIASGQSIEVAIEHVGSLSVRVA